MFYTRLENPLLSEGQNWNFLPARGDKKGGTSFGSSSSGKQNLGRAKDARIVIVDDDPMINMLFTIALKRGGFNVIKSLANGEELIEFISAFGEEDESKRPDVVLLDWKMPALDGLEAAKLLRTSYPTIKIIMISAYELPNESKGYFDAQIRKPVSLEEMLDAVSTVIGS